VRIGGAVRAVRRRLADAWVWLRLLWAGVWRRLLAWVDPLAGTDDAHPKTSREIALENAAESLGVKLGEHYEDDGETSAELPPELRERAGATQEEMLVYIGRIGDRRRLRRRVRRRRVGMLVAVASLLLVGVGVGVAGLFGEPHEAQRRAAQPSQMEGRPRAWFREDGRLMFVREPNDWATKVSVSMRVGRTRHIAVTYVNSDNRLCSTRFEAGGGPASPRQFGGCMQTAGELARRLEGKTVDFEGFQGGSTVFLYGYARRDVVGLKLRGAVVPSFKVRLSEPWRPRVLDSGTVRMFLAVGEANLPANAMVGKNEISAEASDLVTDIPSYTFQARLADGRVVRDRLVRFTPE
jgi:hypothetical protein